MCRLLGVVTRAPMRLSDSLHGQIEPFTKLSCEHADGWGVAAWQDGGMRVIRETGPAHRSPAYARAVGTSVTDTAVLHLRKATPGLAVTAGNTHPFAVGGVAFAHNGYFTPSEALDELIDPSLLARASGTTDSERYFLRVLTRLRDHDPVDALALTAADIRARAAFGSLNCLLMTEWALYAYTEEDPASEVRLRRGPDFFRLRYRVEVDRVVVASSGIPQPDDSWTFLPYGRVLEIRRADLRVSTHHVRTEPAAALHG